MENQPMERLYLISDSELLNLIKDWRILYNDTPRDAEDKEQWQLDTLCELYNVMPQEQTENDYERIYG